MHFSTPTLHVATVGKTADRATLSNLIAQEAAVAQPKEGAVKIAITTVSAAGAFDAYVSLGYSAATIVSMIVDSGNSTLIMPDYSVLSGLPNFASDYRILKDGVTEPWGCPACIVRGPIQLPTADGGTFTVPDCIFFVCKDVNEQGERTANFGIGCISPWSATGGIAMQAPLSYAPDYPFLEVDYADSDVVLQTGTQPAVDQTSLLTLFNAAPPDYRMFSILPNVPWMALRPKSLRIGQTLTDWPGTSENPIAMVDTGGGPAFLSDPNGVVYSKGWPDPVPNPGWPNQSPPWQSVDDGLVIEIGDADGSLTYSIDPSVVPAGSSTPTLVMCQSCYYMFGWNGMNIGGISALFNSILIDYSGNRVGFKPKLPAAESV